MRAWKKGLYLLLLVLTAAVFVCLILWRVLSSNIPLFCGIGLFVPFTALFFFLIADGKKSGWRDEKRLPARLMRERFALDLYIGTKRKKYCLDVYPSGDAEEWLSLLRSAGTSGKAQETLGERCLGQIVCDAAYLNSLEGHTVATDKPTRDLIGASDALARFLSHNDFIIY